MKNFLKKKEKKIKNKNVKKKQIINILIKSKNIYGNFLKKINKEIFPFIYGIRYNYTIIDLKKFSLYLKRIFNLLKKKEEKKILIIANSTDINFLINKNFYKKKKNFYYLRKQWINGLITNNINKKIKFLKKKIKLIIIIKNSINNNFLNKELEIFNIPIISCIKDKQNLKNINYPIISNLKNIKSIYILMYFLRINF
jgi:ribosomal protein S2